MARSITVLQKKRGRPATGVTPLMAFRPPKALREAILRRSKADKVSMTETICRAIEKGLKG
jgi:hypothetical protein